LVKPYVQIKKHSAQSRVVTWEVGGALYVDQTYIRYSYSYRGRVRRRKSKNLRGKTRWAGGSVYKGSNSINKKHVKGGNIDLKYATINRETHPYIGAFRVKLRIPRRAKLVSIQVFAKVDQIWKKTRRYSWPAKVPPQSHLVKARTKPGWNITKNNFSLSAEIVYESEKVCYDNTGAVEIC